MVQTVPKALCRERPYPIQQQCPAAHPTVCEVAEALDLRPVCHNPFMNNVAQIVECFHVVHDVIRLIDELLESGPVETLAKVRPKSGEGASAVEAPRGILFHHYKDDNTGRI